MTKRYGLSLLVYILSGTCTMAAAERTTTKTNPIKTLSNIRNLLEATKPSALAAPKQQEKHKNVPDDTHRNLVWAESNLAPCTQNIIDAFTTVSFTVNGCQMGTIQWDEQGLLEILQAQAEGVRQDMIQGGTRTDVLTSFQAKYTPNQEYCQTFDWCVSDPGDVTPGNLYVKYIYDCRNIYCGPHAARNCDGTYQATTCDGTTLPALPSLASIECDKERSLLSAANLAACPTPCTTYTESGSSIVGSTYACNPQTTACTTDGSSCLSYTLTRIFIEVGDVFQTCITLSNSDQELCIAKIFVGRQGYNGQEYVGQVSCQATATDGNGDDLDCSCTPCTQFVPLGETFSVKVECTDGSQYNECDAATTGAFAAFSSSDLVPVENSSPTPPTTPGNPTASQPSVPTPTPPTTPDNAPPSEPNVPTPSPPTSMAAAVSTFFGWATFCVTFALVVVANG